MKVLMYGWEFPPQISGGLGVACYAIVKELVKKNVKLTLVLPQTITADHIDNVTFVGCDQMLDASEYAEFAGTVDIKYPEITTSLSPYINSKSSRQPFSREARQDFLTLLARMQLSDELQTMVTSVIEAGENIDLLSEVFRYALFAGVLAKDIPHDVIHAHDWLTMLAALEGKRYSHKPVVLHMHALETDRGGLWIDKRIFAIEKYGMEQVDQIIAVSQYTKDNIIQHYGISPEKITVIHNGIYYDDKVRISREEAKKDRPKMVLFVGRITHQKGPGFFLRVAKKVLEKKHDVQFVLVGTGDLLREMIERTANLRIGKNVHFTGFLDSDSVHEIYQLADVYVMPSVSEPFGLSALEAVSHDVPAVISKQSGVAEVLHHTLVADFWDIDDMAAKILALLDYSALSQTSLHHTHGDLQVTTWDKAAEKIIDVYKKVI